MDLIFGTQKMGFAGTQKMGLKNGLTRSMDLVGGDWNHGI
jgi:hypothetical protein